MKSEDLANVNESMDMDICLEVEMNIFHREHRMLLLHAFHLGRKFTEAERYSRMHLPFIQHTIGSRTVSSNSTIYLVATNDSTILLLVMRSGYFRLTTRPHGSGSEPGKLV